MLTARTSYLTHLKICAKLKHGDCSKNQKIRQSNLAICLKTITCLNDTLSQILYQNSFRFSFSRFYLCIGEHVCAHLCMGAHRDEDRTSDSLELEFQEKVSHQMWVLRTELWSSGRIAYACNYSQTSSSHPVIQTHPSQGSHSRHITIHNTSKIHYEVAMKKILWLRVTTQEAVFIVSKHQER